VLDMLAWSTNRLWRARTTLWSRLALHSRDKAESDSRPNTHACPATSINKGQCCRTMLKMKNSSVSLSMLKVLRTWLAASQLTLNGAKESPWRCQCFLIRIITKLVTSVWAVDQATGPQLASKCSLFLSRLPQRILQNTIATSFHLQ